MLVSCKHKAHSGAAVSPDDESDIHDRVPTHGCNGFLGFYSTVPSAVLAAKLNASGLPFEVQVFDAEKIERQLLSSSQGAELAKRFFPFSEEPELSCAYCGTSLLEPKPHGIVAVWTTTPRNDRGSKERTEQLDEEPISLGGERSCLGLSSGPSAAGRVTRARTRRAIPAISPGALNTESAIDHG